MGSIAHVCTHVHISRFRLVVGAPTANWSTNNSVVHPGAIYRCRIGKNPERMCEQLQLGELGLGPEASEPSHPPLVDSTVNTSPGKLMLPISSSLKRMIFTFNSITSSLINIKVVPFFQSIFYSVLLMNVVL